MVKVKLQLKDILREQKEEVEEEIGRITHTKLLNVCMKDTNARTKQKSNRSVSRLGAIYQERKKVKK
jgi:hypothetical protein